jgi:hypothetical protein
MREPEINLDTTDMSALLVDARPDTVPSAAQPPKVPTSVRLPLGIFERLQAIAATRGIGHTQLMCQYIEAGLAAEEASNQVMVPLSEVQQALAQIVARRMPAA